MTGVFLSEHFDENKTLLLLIFFFLEYVEFFAEKDLTVLSQVFQVFAFLKKN